MAASGRFDDILATIGRTPIVRLNRLAPAHANVFVKIESFNPMGSVKDRLALGILEDAERRGALQPGQTVIEATSGNTGIGLAMVCAAKGHPLVVVMAENFSIERRKLMRFLGAKVVLTPAALRGTGMLAKAEELAAKHGWFLCRQFDNEANAEMHSRTTAPEILAAFEGERLDWFVTGAGTGGTLKGVGQVLRAQRPETRIAVCEPDNSPVLASGIPQRRRADGSPAESHPSARPHVMQGWSPDFVPGLTQSALDLGLVDRVLAINGADAMRLARELAQREGIFVGTTAGATLAGALQLCDGAAAGTNILVMLPDTGERYLSTPLFDGIEADMDAGEWDISRSTPGARFDPPAGATAGVAATSSRLQAATTDAPDAEPRDAPVCALPPASAAPAWPAATPDIEDFVASVVNDPEQPVVLFALEWCEFCWALRKLFAASGIAYRAIDLDSTAFQRDERGSRIRSALRSRNGSITIPQVFVDGEFIGGCSETMDAFSAGRLRKHQTRALDEPLDPKRFLPGWIQSR
jgi:cysteine synthase A